MQPNVFDIIIKRLIGHHRRFTELTSGAIFSAVVLQATGSYAIFIMTILIAFVLAGFKVPLLFTIAVCLLKVWLLMTYGISG